MYLVFIISTGCRSSRFSTEEASYSKRHASRHSSPNWIMLGNVRSIGIMFIFSIKCKFNWCNAFDIPNTAIRGNAPHLQTLWNPWSHCRNSLQQILQRHQHHDHHKEILSWLFCSSFGQMISMMKHTTLLWLWSHIIVSIETLLIHGRASALVWSCFTWSEFWVNGGAQNLERVCMSHT